MTGVQTCALPIWPIDRNEIKARVRTQIRKRRYTERLRDNVQMSIEAAITDALTGLHNRRYMETHLATLAEQAASRGKSLARSEVRRGSVPGAGMDPRAVAAAHHRAAALGRYADSIGCSKQRYGHRRGGLGQAPSAEEAAE